MNLTAPVKVEISNQAGEIIAEIDVSCSPPIAIGDIKAIQNVAMILPKIPGLE
jgi:hypothetical protein